MDALVDLCVTGSSGSGCAAGLRLGEPLLDAYLEFVAARCRPNTVLATAFDLKVFFSVVAKSPAEVTPGDVLGFVTAQRAGADTATAVAVVDGGGGGVSARTVRRRLSTVFGLFAFLQARGDVAVNPVPRGLPTRRERSRPGQGVPLLRTARTLPTILSPEQVDALTIARSRCGRTGTRRWWRRWCSAGCAAARFWDCGCRICGSVNAGSSSPRARAGTSG